MHVAAKTQIRIVVVNRALLARRRMRGIGGEAMGKLPRRDGTARRSRRVEGIEDPDRLVVHVGRRRAGGSGALHESGPIDEFTGMHWRCPCPGHCAPQQKTKKQSTRPIHVQPPLVARRALWHAPIPGNTSRPGKSGHLPLGGCSSRWTLAQVMAFVGPPWRSTPAMKVPGIYEPNRSHRRRRSRIVRGRTTRAAADRTPRSRLLANCGRRGSGQRA